MVTLRPREYGERLRDLVYMYRNEFVRVAADGLERMAKELAEASPADTSRLVSNWRVGQEEDLTYIRPYVLGEGGDSKNASIDRLNAENRAHLDRIERVAETSKDATITISLRNETPYLKYLEENPKIGRYVQPIIDSEMNRIRKKYEGVKITDAR